MNAEVDQRASDIRKKIEHVFDSRINDLHTLEADALARGDYLQAATLHERKREVNHLFWAVTGVYTASERV